MSIFEWTDLFKWWIASINSENVYNYFYFVGICYSQSFPFLLTIILTMCKHFYQCIWRSNRYSDSVYLNDNLNSENSLFLIRNYSDCFDQRASWLKYVKSSNNISGKVVSQVHQLLSLFLVMIGFLS